MEMRVRALTGLVDVTGEREVQGMAAKSLTDSCWVGGAVYWECGGRREAGRQWEFNLGPCRVLSAW